LYERERDDKVHISWKTGNGVDTHTLGFVPKPVPVVPAHALHVAQFLTVSVLEGALYSILLAHKMIFERSYSLE